jgi:hypothetical protein
MTAQKHDGYKSRLDLFPWADVAIGDQDFSVKETFAALKIWWTGAPFKLEISLPRRQLRGVCDVLAFGAVKYAPRNWESGLDYSRVFAAAARHALAHEAGEFIDQETGLTHESAFWCNVVFLLTYTARGFVKHDDRPTASPSTRANLDRLETLVASLSGQSPVSSAGLVDKSGKGSN